MVHIYFASIILFILCCQSIYFSDFVFSQNSLSLVTLDSQNLNVKFLGVQNENLPVQLIKLKVTKTYVEWYNHQIWCLVLFFLNKYDHMTNNMNILTNFCTSKCAEHWDINYIFSKIEIKM